MRSFVLAAVFAASMSLLILPPARAADTPAPAASFGQLPGRDGCVRALGALTFDFGGEPLTGCSTASGLGNPRALMLSPDQRQLLVVAGGGDDGSNAIVTLNRAPGNGALSFASCVSHDGGDGRLGSTGTCGDADGLSSPAAVAMTPDGRWLFVASRTSSALTWFARDPETGALTQRGCLKEFTWPSERCTTQPLLAAADGVAVSRDGTLVFVSAETSSAVTAFRRDPTTGGLSPASCVSNTGSDGMCATATGLRGAGTLMLSPDNRTLYVVAERANAVTSFDVDPATATLHRRSCLADHVAQGGTCTEVTTLDGVQSIVLSPDGRDLYVGATNDEAVTALRRRDDGTIAPTSCVVYQSPQAGDRVDESDDEDYDTPQEEADQRTEDGTAGCTPVRALDPARLALSADGGALYAAGDDYLAAFRRNGETGALTWTACAEEELSYKTCVPGRGLPGGSGMAASADGRSLYVASDSSHSVAVFAASLAVASRARVVGRATARLSVTCPASRPVACHGALQHPWLAAAVPFRLGRGTRATLTLPLRDVATRGLRAHASRGLTLTAFDATGFTRAARHRVVLTR